MKMKSTEKTKTQLSAMEMLIRRKQELTIQNLQTQERLVEQLEYVQRHAVGIAFDMLKSSFVHSVKRSALISKSKHDAVKAEQKLNSEGLDIKQMFNNYWPFAWDIAKPVLLGWIVRRGRRFISKFLH